MTGAGADISNGNRSAALSDLEGSLRSALGGLDKSRQPVLGSTRVSIVSHNDMHLLSFGGHCTVVGTLIRQALEQTFKVRDEMVVSSDSEWQLTESGAEKLLKWAKNLGALWDSGRVSEAVATAIENGCMEFGKFVTVKFGRNTPSGVSGSSLWQVADIKGFLIALMHEPQKAAGFVKFESPEIGSLIETGLRRILEERLPVVASSVLPERELKSVFEGWNSYGKSWCSERAVGHEDSRYWIKSWESLPVIYLSSEVFPEALNLYPRLTSYISGSPALCSEYSAIRQNERWLENPKSPWAFLGVTLYDFKVGEVTTPDLALSFCGIVDQGGGQQKASVWYLRLPNGPLREYLLEKIDGPLFSNTQTKLLEKAITGN